MTKSAARLLCTSRGSVMPSMYLDALAERIVRHGLAKIAVYREADGTLHECSAVCPHLGAIVAWNHAEKTWDCPAHGSRFDCRGHVLNGPANTNLQPLTVGVHH